MQFPAKNSMHFECIEEENWEIMFLHVTNRWKSSVCQSDSTKNIRASTGWRASNNDIQVGLRCMLTGALGAYLITTAGMLVKQPVEEGKFRGKMLRSARMWDIRSHTKYSFFFCFFLPIISNRRLSHGNQLASTVITIIIAMKLISGWLNAGASGLLVKTHQRNQMRKNGSAAFLEW